MWRACLASHPNRLRAGQATLRVPPGTARTSEYLTHPVFNTHHSETEMMRYIRRLERKDVGLDTSMIPLGSCTMKLNAAAEMLPVSWPEFSRMHPFAPAATGRGICRDHARARGGALRDHRPRRRIAAAELRRAGRVCRVDDDPRVSPGPRRATAKGCSDSGVRARDESGERHHGRPSRRRRGVRQPGLHRARGSARSRPRGIVTRLQR